MGGVLARAKKPLRNWNLERRLETALDPEKVKLPKREVDTTHELYKKDPKLIERINRTTLKVSGESSIHDVPDPKTRPKLSRDPVVEPEFGYYNIDVKRITPGRTTLARLLDLLSQVSPPTVSGTPPAGAGSEVVPTSRDSAVALTEHKVASLAKEFKLKPEQIAGIASRFRLFDLHIPSSKSTTVQRMQLLSEQIKMGNLTALQLDDDPKPSKPTTPVKDRIDAGSSSRPKEISEGVKPVAQ